MREAELSRTVRAYLDILVSQNKLRYHRLNSGVVMKEYKGKKYPVRLAGKGTADYLVLIPTSGFFRAVYVELKGESGRQSPDQKVFEAEVKDTGAEYYLVRELDELEGIVSGKENNND